jgi:hypothetical protein
VVWRQRLSSRETKATIPGYDWVADTPPGGDAYVQLNQYSDCQCQNDSRYGAVLIRFPKGGSVLVDVSVVSPCNVLGVTPFYAPDGGPSCSRLRRTCFTRTCDFRSRCRQAPPSPTTSS